MAAMATDELRCTICPKAPTFSDQSHLLTHIGSKGHLSHYFKAQVRSATDIASKQRLVTYDDWYRKNGIATLLSQRLDTKDHKQKRSSKRLSSRLPKVDQPDEPTLKTGFEPFPQAPPSANYVPFDASCIDPYLEGMERYEFAMCGKIPLQPMDNMQGLGDQSPDVTALAAHNQFYGQAGHWLPYCQHFEHEDAMQAGFPLPQGSFFDKTPSEVPLPSVEGSVSASHSRNTSTTEGSTVFDATTNSHRLKGAVWPGMDIFDTANEESKRRRNQKKDVSAVYQLAKRSEAIEPTEVIFFYPSWEVKKARFISGNVESSPPRDLTPDTKPRPRRKRRALKEIDSNLPAKPRKTRGAKRFKKPSDFTRSRRDNGALSGSDDETLDLMRPLYGRANQRNRAFKIFEDSPDAKNAHFNLAESTPTPAYSSYTLGSLGYMQQGFGARRSTRGFTTAHTASDGKGGPELTNRDLNPKAEPDCQLFLPESPLRPLAAGDSRSNMNTLQLVTPHRLFLKDVDTQKDLIEPAEPLKRPNARYHYERQSAKRSPSGFSLAELLTFTRMRTPHRSPQKQGQDFWSPSYFDFQAARTNDLVGESSGDETIDLGIGTGE